MSRFSRWATTLSATSLSLVLLVTGNSGVAALIGASSSPKRAEVTAEEGRTLQVRWVISTDSAHENGAYSATGTLRDITTDTVLKTIDTPFNRKEGAGPIFFEETLTLSQEDARKWYDLGHHKLEYKRTFSTGTDGPTTTSAAVEILLASKNELATARPEQQELVAHSLQLSFKPQRFRQQVAQGLPLQAQLFVRFTGRGSLEGRWQLALVEPQGALTYKTLASVKKQISDSSEFLLSPKLPTQTLGRHLLRFCIDSPTTPTLAPASETSCPNPQLSSTLQYDVVESGLAQSQETQATEPFKLNAESRLSWPAIRDTRVYELQIYKQNGKDMVSSSNFVGRLLLPSNTTATNLSPEMINHLTPGTEYTWQINALDQHGDLILQTAPRPFVFTP